MKKAAQAVGSLSDTEFSITFNPDVFQSHVKHAEPEVNNGLFICVNIEILYICQII